MTTNNKVIQRTTPTTHPAMIPTDEPSSSLLLCAPVVAVIVSDINAEILLPVDTTVVIAVSLVDDVEEVGVAVAASLVDDIEEVGVAVAVSLVDDVEEVGVAVAASLVDDVEEVGVVVVASLVDTVVGVKKQTLMHIIILCKG